MQTKLAGEAQAKYERELMLHAADVEALQALKKHLQQEAAQRSELEEQLNKSTALLQEKIAEWSTLERQLKVISCTTETLLKSCDLVSLAFMKLCCKQNQLFSCFNSGMFADLPQNVPQGSEEHLASYC